MTYYAKAFKPDPRMVISLPSLSSLRPHHLATAAAALRDFGSGWSLDAEVDYEGNLSLIVTRETDPCDDISFIVYGGTGSTIRLGMVAAESWTSLGCFATVQDAMRAIAVGPALPHTGGDLS